MQFTDYKAEQLVSTHSMFTGQNELLPIVGIMADNLPNGHGYIKKNKFVVWRQKKAR